MSSENSAKIEFSPSKSVNDKQTTKTKTEEVKMIDDNKPDETLEEPYLDERSVTIALVNNYSLYRRANDKVLHSRQDYIGSSINSSKILSSNKGEVEAYFPNIVGRASNDPTFVTRVKQYLNNIQIKVDELGKKFDTSFYYNHKKDYYRFKKQEEIIEETYQRADKRTLKNLKEALKIKITKLNSLESEKYKYGSPRNIDEYLMYRHCLLYNDIAKDTALINTDPNIRFYFKDDKKEADKLRKFRMEVNKAKANFVTCLSDDKLFEAIYIQYCISKGMPILSALAEDSIQKEINLDKFSNEEPVKFNKYFNNKHIKTMCTIELLIARGELVRYPNNQNITTVDGAFVGANMNEAIEWFTNPENSAIVSSLQNKLNNI